MPTSLAKAGAAYLRLNMANQAEDALTRALSLDPNHAADAAIAATNAASRPSRALSHSDLQGALRVAHAFEAAGPRVRRPGHFGCCHVVWPAVIPTGIGQRPVFAPRGRRSHRTASRDFVRRLPLPRVTGIPAALQMWRGQAKAMYSVNRDTPFHLDMPPLESVVAYYEKHAPETLPAATFPPEPSAGWLQWRSNGAALPDDFRSRVRINVAIATLGSGRPEIVVCDARLVIALAYNAVNATWRTLGRTRRRVMPRRRYLTAMGGAIC